MSEASDRDVKTLIGDAAAQFVADRALLLGAVQQTMVCPLSGQFLNVRRAVLIDGGDRGSAVVASKVWDERGPELLAMFRAEGIEPRLLDGRYLFRGKR